MWSNNFGRDGLYAHNSATAAPVLWELWAQDIIFNVVGSCTTKIHMQSRFSNSFDPNLEDLSLNKKIKGDRSIFEFWCLQRKSWQWFLYTTESWSDPKSSFLSCVHKHTDQHGLPEGLAAGAWCWRLSLDSRTPSCISLCGAITPSQRPRSF